MFTDFLVERFGDHADDPAVIAPKARCTYAELLELWRYWAGTLEAKGVDPGTVVALEGEFSPSSVALFLALVERGSIIVPQSTASYAGRERKDGISEVEVYVRVDGADEVRFERTGRRATHPLYVELRDRSHPGLVLFSSGTSGDPKAAVHDFTFLLEKYHVRRPALSTLTFLLFDHWGGLNTMFHAISNGAPVVAAVDRSPEAVCRLIEEHKIELLPATPTFLNLLLLSGAHRDRDVGSLKVITYGAEPMPESTLKRLREAFPTTKLQQTYGLIEVGVLRSKSRDDGSLWVKLGGEGYETRVVDGVLQIKTKATILGYLNAPTPITSDGWFITGDAVLQDGDYFRVLGRTSELINVGGEKVYPAEVESVIQSMANVADATVYGEKNALMGQIVCARVRTSEAVDRSRFVADLKQFCAERLDSFKVPVKVQVVDELQVGDRFKKLRHSGETA